MVTGEVTMVSPGARGRASVEVTGVSWGHVTCHKVTCYKVTCYKCHVLQVSHVTWVRVVSTGVTSVVTRPSGWPGRSRESVLRVTCHVLQHYMCHASRYLVTSWVLVTTTGLDTVTTCKIT